MPSRRTGGGYCKWAVIDKASGSAVGELTQREAITAAKRMNEAHGTDRYAPGKHIGQGQYRSMDTERTKRGNR